MRKTMLLSLMCLLLGTAFAQQRFAVIGKVLDSRGDAVPGATITEKGTSNAVAADDAGNFRILVNPGATLNIAAIGFTAYDVPAAAAVKVRLQNSNAMMDEVVVTALGIQRSKNSLGYVSQEIKGDEISKLRTNNAAAALSGKIAGLEIRQGNGIGGSTNVVIRGFKSVTGNNQALFVVDGIPIDNTNNNTTDQTTGRDGYDFGNAAADINPDDIASINVLKGAASTALYGSRAANGVIMITTKQGKKGLGVTVNSGVMWSRIDRKTMPDYQKEYGAGYSDPYDEAGFFVGDPDGDGVEDYIVPTSEDASYGAKFDPNLMVYHWDAFDVDGPNYLKKKPWVAAQNDPRDFYETGLTVNNSIFITGGNDRASVKLGYTRNDDKGSLPNSRILKNMINFGLNYKITDKLTISSNINYSRIDGNGRYGTGYSGQNVNQNFRQWYQTNVDIKEQKDAFFRNGRNVTWNWADPLADPSELGPIYTDNYYWIRYKNFETDQRNRIFGYVKADYKLTDWLSLMGRITVDNYSEFQDERIAIGSTDIPEYKRFDRSFNETNFDLLATVNKDLSTKLNFKALAGVNLRKSAISSTKIGTSGGLVFDDYYAISNSVGPLSPPIELYQPKRVDGYFAGATFTFDEFITIDGTFRRDRSSALPVDNNAYNYYGISGSWLFSHHLENLDWLSVGKLRLNYATVANDAPWGIVNDTYTYLDNTDAVSLALFGGGAVFSLPSRKNNQVLKPEQSTTQEAGLELAFLKGRLGLDLTFYKVNSIDQIIPVTTSTATGYSSAYKNAGEMENKGIEIALTGKPVSTPNFSWDINVNFTRNRNKLISLFDTAKNLLLATTQGGVSVNATVGQPYGTLQGKMVETLNGQKVVDADGYYIETTTTTNVLGNINPDWMGGIYNTLRFKDISFGFLIDIRKGGSVFSLDRYYGAQTGVTVDWAGLNDLGNPKRDDPADGGGIIMPGVTEDGKINTQHVVKDAYVALPVSEFVYDASYVKLREVVLTYALPARIIEKTKAFKSIELSLIGRNLWIIHKNLPYSDPEENLSSGNIQGIQSGAYPTNRYVGFNLKLSL